MEHRIEQREGSGGFYRDTIVGVEKSPDFPQIRWTVGYQGETDFEDRSGRRLKFRHTKVAWEVPWCPTRYWNYESEAAFEAQHNGNWGILSCGNEPVDAETLATFRTEHYPSAVTGYFDHFSRAWKECEPTKERLSHKSWVESGGEARWLAEYASRKVA